MKLYKTYLFLHGGHITKVLKVEVSTPEKEIPKRIWFDNDGYFHFCLLIPKEERWIDIYNNVEAREFVENLRLMGDPVQYIVAITNCLITKNYSVDYLTQQYKNYGVLNLDDYNKWRELHKEEKTLTEEEKAYFKEVDELYEEFQSQIEKFMHSLNKSKPWFFKWGNEREQTYGYDNIVGRC